MTDWDELQPALRQRVLQRGERTVEDVAEEIDIGRSTLYQLMGDEVQPRRSVIRVVETYLAEKPPEAEED